jgi:hypothetical protein
MRVLCTTKTRDRARGVCGDDVSTRKRTSVARHVFENPKRVSEDSNILTKTKSKKTGIQVFALRLSN